MAAVPLLLLLFLDVKNVIPFKVEWWWYLAAAIPMIFPIKLTFER